MQTKAFNLTHFLILKLLTAKTLQTTVSSMSVESVFCLICTRCVREINTIVSKAIPNAIVHVRTMFCRHNKP